MPEPKGERKTIKIVDRKDGGSLQYKAPTKKSPKGSGSLPAPFLYSQPS